MYNLDYGKVGMLRKGKQKRYVIISKITVFPSMLWTAEDAPLMAFFVRSTTFLLLPLFQIVSTMMLASILEV